jgi:uncharacterized membrane protein (UPF0182 family)
MGPRGKWLVKLAVAAALIALLGGRWLAVSTADALWAEALGVGATHAHVRSLQTMLLLTAFVAAASWCLGNLYLVYRSIGSVHVPRRLGNLEILEAVPRHYLLVAAAAAGLLLAIAFSHRADGWWYARALAGFDVPLGVTDPVLGRDIGYYLYQLPWQRTIHSFVTLLSGVMLGITAVLYAAVGAIRWGGRRRLRVNDLARWHLAGLLLAFALALFWGYRLEPAEYVAGIHDVPADTVLSGVRIPVARMLSVLALITAGASLFWMWSRRVAVVVVPWTLLAAVSFAGHYLVPAFAGAVRTPEELHLEQVEASRSAFLREAFGAGSSHAMLDLGAPPEPSSVRQHRAELEAGPLWDAFAVTVFLNRAAAQVEHLRVTDATLGVYRTARGRAVPVYVAAREVDLAAARNAAVDLSWERVHVGEYAAASGAVAVQAHGISETGLPLFVTDLERPDSGRPRLQELMLDDPRVLFSPGAVNFAVLPQGGAIAGVPAGSWWRQLALAWSLQSPRLVTSDAVADTSLVLWHRDIVGRLDRYAPFARFSAPHAVVADGRLYWLATGYVRARAFPLVPRTRWRRETVRYLRSSLVGVVEASTGETAVYLTDDSDPLSRAWAQIAPEIVRPAGQMPGELASHLRYPRELFAIQLGLLQSGGASGALLGAPAAPMGVGRLGGVEPYWWVGGTPADSVVRLRLMAALEAGESEFLAGIVDATVRGGSSTLTLLQIEPELEVPGPTRAARLFTRLRADPIGVQGALRLVPFENGVLALQVSYASPGEGQAAPQLVDVAVGWGREVGSGPTVRSALDRVETEASPFGMAAAERAEARRWFERMDAARRSGDWTAFGRAYEELRRILTGGTDSVP